MAFSKRKPTVVAPATSRLCPDCGAGLRTSKGNWVYCPNKYADSKPCPFKGFPAGGSVKVSGIVGTIKPLEAPSAEQLAIMTACQTATGNMLVEALAGTGKSTLLVQLVRIFADRSLTVLCVSFAKRDKLNLESKVAGRAKVLTSNGAGLSILSNYCRRFGARLNFNDDADYQILESKLRADGLIKLDAETGRDKWDVPAGAVSVIKSLVEKARTCLPLAAPAEPTEKEWQELSDRFSLEVDTADWPIVHHYAVLVFRELASLKNMLVWGVDFAGQVFLPVYHGLKPDTTYDRVLVDEAQDQSYVTRSIARLFTRPDTGRIVAVGDRNQAIYSWRGADFAALDEMKKLMESNGGAPSTFPLTLCRRCATAIIGEAQNIVPAIQALPDAVRGEVRSITEDKAFIAELIERRKGLVICRANAPSMSICLKLLAARVPAAMARSNIVGDLITLIDKCAADKGDQCPVVDVLEAANAWLSDRLAKLAKRQNGAAQSQVATDKVACIVALSEEQSVQTAGGLKRKIDQLFPCIDGGPNADTMVVFYTVHGVKGGESKSVYLYSPEGQKVTLWDQIWTDAIDRDNTLYVAITRAELELTYAGMPPSLVRMSDADPDAE